MKNDKKQSIKIKLFRIGITIGFIIWLIYHIQKEPKLALFLAFMFLIAYFLAGQAMKS